MRSSWTAVLPDPYNTDPEVGVMVFAPHLQVAVVRVGKVTLVVAREDDEDDPGRLRGLQVQTPRTADYRQQCIVAESAGVHMVPLAWKGRLSSLPDRVWTRDNQIAVVTYHDWTESLLLLRNALEVITRRSAHRS